MKKTFVVLTLFLFLFCEISFSQGCSQCKAVVEQASELEEGSFGSNINMGILYIMIIPYLILLFFFRDYIIRFFKSLIKRS